jgi:UDP-N-acetylmuramoyl-L-alanyl-D-glutamate--2,6-diaminopimelate ligase
MASVAERWSDICVVTSDNPRSESQYEITEDITQGFKHKNHVIINDRADAIKCAIDQARAGDVILVAGKGHEELQVFNGQSRNFSDVECLSSLLNAEVIND